MNLSCKAIGIEVSLVSRMKVRLIRPQVSARVRSSGPPPSRASSGCSEFRKTRNSSGSAAQYYYEFVTATNWSEEWSADDSASGSERDAAGWQPGEDATPTAVLISKEDVTVRPWAERDYHVVRWTEHDRGGHFFASEQPELFAADVREFFAEL